uniref:Uncharacterized protein n=1 Tax=Desertifilum tharense IPPAS B-1220 TaxID=1781255 RepID=A0ACD5GT40_9CYAN
MKSKFSQGVATTLTNLVVTSAVVVGFMTLFWMTPHLEAIALFPLQLNPIMSLCRNL